MLSAVFGLFGGFNIGLAHDNMMFRRGGGGGGGPVEGVSVVSIEEEVVQKGREGEGREVKE